MPLGALDLVAASWTIGAEEDADCRGRVLDEEPVDYASGYGMSGPASGVRVTNAGFLRNVVGQKHSTQDGYPGWIYLAGPGELISDCCGDP